MLLIYHPPLYLFTTHEDIKNNIEMRGKKLVRHLRITFFILNAYLDLINKKTEFHTSEGNKTLSANGVAFATFI